MGNIVCLMPSLVSGLKKDEDVEKQEPVRFENAVGRKYSIPYHLACKCDSLESPIKSFRSR